MNGNKKYLLILSTGHGYLAEPVYIILVSMQIVW